MKRIISAVLASILLISMITVSASTPGSADNPLISRSYIDGTYAPGLLAEVRLVFADAAEASISSLEDMYGIGNSFAAYFTDVTLAQGETITLAMGSSFILQSGSATLTFTSGTVINISTGNEVPSGSALTLRQRYFCAENTSALIKADTAAAGQVDGYYRTDGTLRPEPPPSGQLPFTDVARANWFYPAVEFAFTNGLFLGTSPTLFSPGMSMTRGMFVTVLHRYDGEPAVGANGGFSDVSNPSLYYYDPVIWAHDNGIISGHSDNTFRPNDPVTREQMAAIMFNYAAHKGQDMSSSAPAFEAFPDSGVVSPYAVPALQWAVTRGIIRGSGGSLLPRDTATRAEVAQIILNYYESTGR